MSEGIAIVGMACRYPDARSPAELWENALAQRRAFRRMPEERLRLADYRAAAAGDPDSIDLDEAAVLAGWEFDRVRFRVAGATFRAADLTHWLALEVAAQALADGGFAEGAGLPRDTTGVLLGNSLTGEFSRAGLLRGRWPYVRRVLGAGLAAEGWEAGRVAALLARLEAAYKAPFPEPTEESLAGGLSNTIAGRICNHFDLHGGGYTVDGACASSLLAVAQACTALVAGDLDVALAGGVNLSLDPFELVGFARAGALAAGEMRVYDARSDGFVPGEGCGFVVLMREGEAVAAGKRIHGVVRGWGVSSDGHGGISRPEAAGQRLAIARAYRRAGFGIETVAYFEGHGTGTAVGDATELAALARALDEAPAGAGRGDGDGRGGSSGSGGSGGQPAVPPAIGSIKANIGHTKAAAGLAGLLKATLAAGNQILPPATGCQQPHAELAGASPALRVLAAAEPWPADRPLRAGVSAMGFGGINVHLVVEAPAAARRHALSARERRLAMPPQDAELVVLAADDAARLAAQVRRLAELAPRLSRAELGDLAAELHRRLAGAASGRGPEPAPTTGAAVAGGASAASPTSVAAAETVARTAAGMVPGTGPGRRVAGVARAAVVAGTPMELAGRLETLAGWLAQGVTRRLDTRQGVSLAIGEPGTGARPPRVGLLFTGQGSPTYAEGASAPGTPRPVAAGDGAGALGGALARRFAELAGLYELAARCIAEVQQGRAAAGTGRDGGSPGAAAPHMLDARRQAGADGASPPADGDGTPPPAARGGASPATDGDGTSADTAVAQPAILAHDLAGLWLLERLGVEGSVAVGHSLGEIAALCWAGGCDAAAALRLAAARGRAMARRGAPGAMASLAATPAAAAELLSGTGATIAAYNGPSRTVVSGSPDEVAMVVARAAQRGLTATPLKVARAFHSPRVAAAADDLRDALASLAWAPLRRPVASTVTGQLLAPDADVSALLLAQVTAPVRFTGAMAAAQPLADLWIEIGPGRALAELAAESLGEPVLSLDAGGSSWGAALSAAGALFVAGVPLDLGPLFADRFSRPFDLDDPPRFLANPCESAPRPRHDAAAGDGQAAAGARAATGIGAGGAAAGIGSGAAPSAGSVGVAATRTSSGAAATGIDAGAAALSTGAAPALPSAVASEEPIELVRDLVAARAELPRSAVRDDSRLLSDLHLNSITVGQLVVEASHRLGLPPPASPTDYAQATIAEVAQALGERCRLELAGGEAGAAPAGGGDRGPGAMGSPAGIDAWVRPFTVELVERPLPPRRAGAARSLAAGAAAPRAAAGDLDRISGWQIIAPPDHPLAASLAAALDAVAPAAGASAILLCLPAELEEDAGAVPLELFAAAARAATAAPAPGRFAVVQHGGGGGGFARTLHLELPATATWVLDLPAGVDPETAAAWVAAEIAGGGAPAMDGTRRPADTSGAFASGGAAAGVTAGAAAGAAGHVEAHYDARGTRRVPVLRLLELAAPVPGAALAGLGPGDVLLATGGGKGIGAECALAVARSTGARLALIGRADPGTDRELAANLARIAAAGVPLLYVAADLADAPAVRDALMRITAQTGPVTALLHAAGVNEPRRLGEIDAAGLHRTLAPKVDGAANVLSTLDAVQPGVLRLAVAFGSIIARTGLRGEAEYALANEWLALRLERYAAAHPACRCLLLDWSVWSGVGMGERLGTLEALSRQGIAPIPPAAGAAELLRLLADPAVRGAVVVTGRFGNPPTLALERPDLPLLRFLETPRVHYPGIELIADTEISAATDPYLADHVFRGEPLFAAVLGLEAMAQAAAAVTGARDLPVFENVEFRRPIAVAPNRSTTLRLAALVRAPGLVEVALRDSSTGFAADHFRAFCRFPDRQGEPLHAPNWATAATGDSGSRDGGSSGLDGDSGRLDGESFLGPAPWPSGAAAVPAGQILGWSAGAWRSAGSRLAIDPPRDLYGGILFHTGRFRRLGGYRQLGATRCLAEIVPDGSAAWFGRYLPPALLLGDPAARDAAIHGIQACIPHAQLLPIGVERIVSHRIAADQPLLLAARERRRDGDTFTYDLDILTADGALCERWQGLQLRAVDRTHLPASWTAPLLTPYLERRLQEILCSDGLRVALEPGTASSAEEPAAGRRRDAAPPTASRHPGRPDSALVVARLLAASQEPDAPAAHGHLAGRDRLPAAAWFPAAPDSPPAPLLTHRPDGRPDLAGGPQVSIAHAGSLVLAVLHHTPDARLGCDLEPIVERSVEAWRGLLGAERFALAELISRQQGEPPSTAATRVWTAAESLHKAGSPANTPLLFDTALDDGWLLLRAGDLQVAVFAGSLRDLGGPFSLAVAVPATELAASLTGPAPPDLPRYSQTVAGGLG